MNQDTKVHEDINSFPLEENGYPDCENPAPILPYSTGTFFDLDNLDLLQLVRDLQDRCDRQESEIASLKEMIAEQKQDYESIASVDKEREKEFSLLNEHLVKTIIRVSVLERELKAKKAAPTEKTSPHLDKLAARLMKKREAKQFPAIGFKEASQLLGISKRRVSQLQPTIKADGRFIVQAHGKTLYIQLR